MRNAILGTVFLCFGIASVASADPVPLTSGRIVQISDGPTSVFVNASGSGFAVAGSGQGGLFAGDFNVGETVDLSRQISFSPAQLDTGSITYGNVTHSGYLAGSFQITATPFVLDSSVPVFDPQTFTTRFSLTGMVQLFAQPFSQLPPLFTQEVTGTGTASFDATNIGDGHFIVKSGPGGDSFRLTFGPASNPSPTPEPASLLLLATGVAPLLLRRRRHE